MRLHVQPAFASADHSASVRRRTAFSSKALFCLIASTLIFSSFSIPWRSYALNLESVSIIMHLLWSTFFLSCYIATPCTSSSLTAFFALKIVHTQYYENAIP